MTANIRIVVRTAALSLGASGLIAIAGNLLPALPDTTRPDEIGVALPAVSTEALEIHLAGAQTPALPEPITHEETVSGLLEDLTALSDESTVTTLLHETGIHYLTTEHEVTMLVDHGADWVENSQGDRTGQYATEPKRDTSDPVESLGLSTEDLLGEGLLSEVLPL